MLNPKLKVGDRIVLYHMEDETIPPMTKGTVIRVSRDPFEEDQVIYNIDWDNGRTLALLSGIDNWKKIERLEESTEDMQWFINNRSLPKYFNLRVLKKYLMILRETGIVNMFGAASYLYMGRERIAHEFVYNEPPNEEKFEELLDMADEAQSIMINGVIKYLEDNNKDLEVSAINSWLHRFSVKILQYYMKTF